jgi:hypothetical protein
MRLNAQRFETNRYMVFVSPALGVVHLSHRGSMASIYRAVGTAADIRKFFSRGLTDSTAAISEGSVGPALWLRSLSSFRTCSGRVRRTSLDIRSRCFPGPSYRRIPHPSVENRGRTIINSGSLSPTSIQNDYYFAGSAYKRFATARCNLRVPVNAPRFRLCTGGCEQHCVRSA